MKPATTMLAEIVAEHLLSCADTTRAQVVLKRAMHQDMVEDYAGGLGAFWTTFDATCNAVGRCLMRKNPKWVHAVLRVVENEMRAGGADNGRSSRGDDCQRIAGG